MRDNVPTVKLDAANAIVGREIRFVASVASSLSLFICVGASSTVRIGLVAKFGATYFARLKRRRRVPTRLLSFPLANSHSHEV